MVHPPQTAFLGEWYDEWGWWWCAYLKMVIEITAAYIFKHMVLIFQCRVWAYSFFIDGYKVALMDIKLDKGVNGY